MKHEIFSVFDQKAEAYMPPFVMSNEALGVRVFTDCVNKPGHPFAEHPEDYYLYKVGFFDDARGEVQTVQLRLVVKGLDCIRKPMYRGLEESQDDLFEDDVKEAL